MKFRCDKCGRKLNVPDTLAGKKGRCPQCRHVVTVPKQPASDARADNAAASCAPPEQASSLLEVTLLDVAPLPAETVAAPQQSDEGEAALQRLRAMHGGRLPGEQEPVPRRTLPWFIDIFFYPLSKAGLTILLICAGVPFLLRIMIRFFMAFTIVFGPALILWVVAIIFHWLGVLLFLLYINWYACECIRDSAGGGIRAVDTIATTPGLGELLAQGWRVLVCALFVTAPALVYVARTHRADQVFRVLYGVGGFVFPMALLAVVMYDSFAGLNPVLLLRSILRTHVKYCVLVPFCYLLCVLVPFAGHYMLATSPSGYLLMLLAFYNLLILSHLLGRFYRKNEERLDWDA